MDGLVLPAVGIAAVLLFAQAPILAEETSDRNKREGRTDESPEYRQGYSPEKTHRSQVRSLPDDAWGEAVNGLQAAISAPARIRFNEVMTVYFVIRNVSDRTIRFSHPPHPDIVYVQRDGESLSYGASQSGGPMSFWELQPGHQTLIPSPPIQVTSPGDLGLKRALTKLTAGPHTIDARSGSGRYRWVPVGDGTSRKFFPPEGEWTGWLTAPRRAIEVVAEKVPFGVEAPGDFPDDHGLTYVLGPPPSVNNGRTEWIQIRDGLEFALDGSQDAHWLMDYGTYNQTVSWGPIPAAKLNDLDVLDRIRKISHEYIQTADHDSQVDDRIGVLLQSRQPLAEMGLDFITTMPPRKDQSRIPSDYLARTIRDRRVELEAMGLNASMQRALGLLTANDPPMPDDSEFRIVENREVPSGLNDKSWGPPNAGLQAAALMPKSLKAGATEDIRLFIRNVSESDVRLAVSKRVGYDYATAVDTTGKRLTAMRPYVYPGAFGSVIMPEVNPGQMTQSPPTATLEKILLRPGAVLELATKTGLAWHVRRHKPRISFGTSPEDDQFAVTHITSSPMTARVTWHLHTANGAIHSSDLKRRLWPAKGSWSGILRTAPVNVQLRP